MTKTYYVKDKETVCPKCHTKNSMKDLISKGVFDMGSFEDNSMPEWFNPFDKSSSGDRDRICLSYDCKCKKCGQYLNVNLACCIFGYDVFAEECDLVDSQDTELIE